VPVASLQETIKSRRSPDVHLRHFYGSAASP
jgi:hypothetical protein